MIRLAHIVESCAAEFIAQYGHGVLPSQLAALNALQTCRSSMSPRCNWPVTTAQNTASCRIPAGIARVHIVRRMSHSAG